MLVRAPAQEVEPSVVGDGRRSRRSIATLVATLYSLTAMRTVESATERSLPGAPGQVTVTASFHKRTAIALAALSRSGVEPGGAYCAITAVHAYRPSSELPCSVLSFIGASTLTAASLLSA